MPSPPYPILHVIDSLGLGGAQQVLLGLLKHCDRARFAPEVAVLHGHGMFENDVRALNVPVHILSPWRSVPLYVPNLLRLILLRKYAIVHSHLVVSNLLAQPMAALARVPLRMSYEHSNHPFRRSNQLHHWLDLAAHRMLHHTIAVSRSAHDYLISQQNVAESDVTFVPNGVDLERFHPQPQVRVELRRQWNLSPDERVVIGVGRLCFQKNMQLWLRVADRIVQHFPQTKFLIAGDGGDRAELEQLADELRLNENVRFLGTLSNPTDLYAIADAFLLTSRYEGTPMTVLEAMACGVPVVASQVDGVAEVIDSGNDGLLAAAEDEAGFAESVISILNNADLAQSLSQAASEKIRRNYSAESMARKVEQVYVQLLSGEVVV